MRRSAVTACLWLTVFSSIACAEQRLDSVLARLQREDGVRLKLSDGRSVKAYVEAVAPDQSGMQITGQSAPVPAGTIDSLWVKGTASRTGAIIGGCVLGVVGLVAGVGLAYDAGKRDEEQTTGQDVAKVVGGTLVGAAVGAVIGAAIGSGATKWKLKYGRPVVSLASPGSMMGASIRLSF